MPGESRRSNRAIETGAACLIAAACVLGAGVARAADDVDHGTGASLREEDKHGHHRHHVSAFTGGGFRPHEGDTEIGFVLGLDYQYRFTSWFSAGGLVEAATGDLREVVFIVPVTVKPWRGLNFIAGPGVEVRKDDPSEFLFRVGAIYLFDIGLFTIGPEFSVDIVEGEPTYITGLVLGVGF